jgi:hypothetical protein
VIHLLDGTIKLARKVTPLDIDPGDFTDDTRGLDDGPRPLVIPLAPELLIGGSDRLGLLAALCCRLKALW